MLDGHFVVEQTTRNRTGGFLNFNGRPALRQSYSQLRRLATRHAHRRHGLSFRAAVDGLEIYLFAG